MNRQILAAAGLLIVLLQACSSGQQPEDKAASEQPQHVWKDQVEALEKAQNLENEMNSAFQKRADEIDRRTR
jgi:hypothetical protein